MENLNSTILQLVSDKTISKNEWKSLQKVINKETEKYFSSLPTTEMYEIQFMHYGKNKIFYTTSSIIKKLKSMGYNEFIKSKKVLVKVHHCDIENIEYASKFLKKYSNKKEYNDAIKPLYDITIISDKILFK